MADYAKVFKSGGSQAVRLPKAYRINGDEVVIKRLGPAILIFPRSRANELFSSAVGSAPDFPDRDQPKYAGRRKRI